MIKRITLSSVLAIIFLSCSIAQKTDQVTLKNGSVIRGSIIEVVPDDKVSIDDLSGNTWVFNMNEVKKLEKVDDNSIKPAKKTIGLMNMTSIGFLAGSQSSDYIAPFSMITSVGYKSNIGLYTGLAVGLEFLNINHIPIMLDLQYYLIEDDVSPYLMFRAGYALPSKFKGDYYGSVYEYSGGPTGGLGIGLKIQTRRQIGWDISAGYRYLQVNYTENNEWNPSLQQYKDIYNRLELRLGFFLLLN